MNITFVLLPNLVFFFNYNYCNFVTIYSIDHKFFKKLVNNNHWLLIQHKDAI